MNKFFALCGLAALFGGATLTGCQNTAQGAAEDTKQAAQTVEAGAERAASAVDKATEGAVKAADKATDNAGAALSVTPIVKAAITGDAQLNDTANHIDVDSADGVVHLKGSVTTNELKKKAEEVAQKALTDAGKTDKISNELVVGKH
jgi:predicted small secreted protein